MFTVVKWKIAQERYFFWAQTPRPLLTDYQGLDDLRMGVIRTPMPPMETFKDDPLRVLRCIRFASRFGFDIVPQLKSAVKDTTIQVVKPLNMFLKISYTKGLLGSFGHKSSSWKGWRWSWKNDEGYVIRSTMSSVWFDSSSSRGSPSLHSVDRRALPLSFHLFRSSWD